MANSYKDIIITPNRSNTADPKIEFRGGNTTVNTAITLQTYPTSNGTLSFEGAAGQLFSITNDLTGSIFSVNDVSGIPSIEVWANGQIDLAPFGGNVTINGNATFGAADHLILSSTSGISANGSYGTAGQMLTSNGTVVYWSTPQIGDITAVAAGAGLTGGGTSGDVTINIGAGTGITVNADDIAVNSAYIATITSNNATFFGGYTWASPAALGTTTANSGAFTTISASGIITSSVGANAITFTNGTSNYLMWNTAGVIGPSATTRSAGTKVVLYPAVSSTAVDYALGIESGHMWLSAGDTSAGFKWYSNTTNIMTANTTGLNLNTRALSGVTTAAMGNTTITGFANVTGSIQGGSTLTIAGAASGITTLAAGNTTITGFANVTTTLQVGGLATFNGNVQLNAADHLILSSTSGVSANGTYGTNGQVLTTNGSVVYWGAGGSAGAAANGVIWENNVDINTTYTLSANKNGLSVGPINIASGNSVTIPSGARWVIL